MNLSLKQKDLESIRELLDLVEIQKKAKDLAPAGSLLEFTKWFFETREGLEFNEGPHHRVIGKVLDDVIAGRRNRVIITLPPGYTKTEMAVVNFIAKGFQVNARAKFIHATFSDPLAGENSDKAKAILELEDYQELSEARIDPKTHARDRWKTIQGGGLLAKASGGPITGFRAGYMDKTKFTGALIVDDPLKPDDAFSPAARDKVNKRATNTFRSRLAHEGVPIIVIMQRLHNDDFVGYLLRGGSGDVWDHLELPVEIDHNLEYPKDWTHGRPIAHGLPEGPLWKDKHDEQEIQILKADSYTFSSQYKQRPVSVEGALFEMDGFRWWKELPPMEYYRIYADTAQKTKERNDYSVFQLWGKAKGTPAIYLVDQLRGKWEAPELESNALVFWAKHKNLRPRGMKVEDKSSGTGLIQSLKKKAIPIMAIQRSIDKYTRGMDAAPWIANGMVHLPDAHPDTPALRLELQQFDGLGTGHDDQVDPLMDAVSEMLGGSVYDLAGAV